MIFQVMKAHQTFLKAEERDNLRTKKSNRFFSASSASTKWRTLYYVLTVQSCAVPSASESGSLNKKVSVLTVAELSQLIRS